MNLPDYKYPVSLIPGGCPQFLDYGGEISLVEKIRYTFEEIAEKGPNGQNVVHLRVYRKNEDGDLVDEVDPSKRSKGYGYDLTAAKSLEPWLGEWLPVPFLRVRTQTWPDSDDCRFEYGPTNWARARLTRSETSPNEYRLVIAFDMQVEKGGDAYGALTEQDVESNAYFKLAWRFRDNAWYMDLPWVEEWLREVYNSWKKRSGSRRQDDDRQFTHLASYLVYLAVLEKLSENCEVYVIRPDGASCVDVDLVLDIGNSRTTGMLIETQTQSTTNLNNSYLLQLRDIDKPENIYTEPFDTRIEFCEANFGNEALGLRSGRRTPAFVWPSPVRIGPEAARLCARSRNEKGSTGMSSPKRYLWDEREWKRSWRFNTGTEKSPYVTRGPLAQLVNSGGTPLCCMDDPRFFRNANLKFQEKDMALESLYTRSSLMMFLLVEIIHQALLTINSPAQRQRKDDSAEPRRLSQIIYTVPPGMPAAEQKIYKRWVEWAVRALWEALGWEQYYVGDSKRAKRDAPRDYRTSPVIRCDWDEAACTQLVYVYNEISRKFQGDGELFCELVGRKRQFGEHSSPSVRVATIDIGGGTTDLSITDFELVSDSGSTVRMAPHQIFHDGFNLAGDDILRAIVSEHILEAVGNAMEEAGVADMRGALKILFGRDTMDSSKDMLDRRCQFIRQIAVPCALTLLSLYEKSDRSAETDIITLKIGDCFEAAGEDEQKEYAKASAGGHYPAPAESALQYVRDYVAAKGGNSDFNVMDIELRINVRRLDATVKSVLADVLGNLCEVVNARDCDILLLTGRPSCWPGIVETIYSQLPLPPGKIQPMNAYKVGGWYPFSDALGNITDPKTTVVVGAILCALAEGQLEGFSFDASTLGLMSTARYIGQMELNGQLKNKKVWFNVNPEKNEIEPETAEVIFNAPLAVGFRQLPVERWTTTRFYLLEFASEDLRREHAKNLPFKVKLKLELSGDEENSGESGRDEGEFFIEEITDKNNDDLPAAVLEMRLQTLPRNEGFWMDTGIIMDE